MRDIVPLGDSFIVNSTILNDQHLPNTASLQNGNYVVVYTSRDTGWLHECMVRGRIFGADGAPIGDDFLLTSGAGGLNGNPVVTALPDGGFLTCWTVPGNGIDVLVRSFDAFGTPRGPEYMIPNPEQLSRLSPQLATQPDGSTLVVWDSFWSGKVILGCFINSDGQTVGGPFELQTSADNVFDVTVTALKSGGFFVAYKAQDAAPGVNNGGDVFGRFLAADGSPVGDEILIARKLAGTQMAPSVAELGSVPGRGVGGRARSPRRSAARGRG